MAAAQPEWYIPAVMDRLRSWRSLRPTGRAGARRAGVTALAILVVTAALAVLLAVLSHLAWPPVLVTILGGVPTLYLAWAALPGAITLPEGRAVKVAAPGRLAGRWEPVELGVHRVIGGGPIEEIIGMPLRPCLPT